MYVYECVQICVCLQIPIQLLSLSQHMLTYIAKPLTPWRGAANRFELILNWLSLRQLLFLRVVVAAFDHWQLWARSKEKSSQVGDFHIVLLLCCVTIHFVLWHFLIKSPTFCCVYTGVYLLKSLEMATIGVLSVALRPFCLCIYVHMYVCVHVFICSRMRATNNGILLH